jgi:hypothetical protein
MKCKERIRVEALKRDMKGELAKEQSETIQRGKIV